MEGAGAEVNKTIMLEVEYSVLGHPLTDDQWAAILEAGARMYNYFDHGPDDVSIGRVGVVEVEQRSVMVVKS